MSSTWTHKYVSTRITSGPSGHAIKATRTVVTAGLNHLPGNSRPYFSVTCSIDEQARNNRWMESGGGAAHDIIVKRFPSLAPVVALHLSDDRGTPMHAAANALYHAGFSSYPERRNVNHLASHLRISVDDAERLIASCESTDDPAAALTAFVDAQSDRWAQEARDAIAVLDELIAAQELRTSSVK
jgi:hypothetical protein